MSDVELVNADGVTVFRGTQSGGGSQPDILQSKTLLTAAQIKGSDPDAGLTLVAAPGADKIIVPALFMGVYRAGAVPFDNPGAAVFVGSGYAASVWYGSWASTISGSSDKISTYDFFSNRLDSDNEPFTDLNDAPLAMVWGTTPTVGDGSLTVFCWYSVLDIS